MPFANYIQQKFSFANLLVTADQSCCIINCINVLIYFTSIFSDFSPGAIRLENGPSASSGRVEIYHDGRWGTVCHNWWDTRDARYQTVEIG